MPAWTIPVVALVLSICLSPMASAGSLDEIKANGEIKLGYRTDTPPFSSLSASGSPEGFTVDLCRIIAKDIQSALELKKMNISWVGVTAENRFDAVASGRIHLECAASTVTFSRQETVDFSNLIYATGASLMRRIATPIDNVRDLQGRRVSVVAATTTEGVLRDALAQNAIEAKVITVPSHADGLKMLYAGDIDAMAGDQATLFGIITAEEAEDDLIITEDMLSFEPYALPLRRDDADFRLAVNRALSALYVRGDVGRSWQQWFGQHDVQATRMLLMLYRLNSFAE